MEVDIVNKYADSGSVVTFSSLERTGDDLSPSSDDKDTSSGVISISPPELRSPSCTSFGSNSAKQNDNDMGGVWKPHLRA
jgi:hypothetical protein